MDNRYKTKKIDYKEIDKIAQLYTICFSRTKSVNFFKWKYFDNPTGEALCLAVKDDGNIVGSCVMIPEEFYVFGKKMKIYKCCDLMVHPQYRRQGISTKLISSLSEHLKQSGPLFLYTLCGKNATPGFLKNQWLKLDDVSYYFKHKNQLKVKFFFNRLEKLYNRRILRQINSISDLCKNYKFKIDDTKIHIVKDEKYFRWRLKNPRYKYNIIGYYEKDILNGYIIYNIGIKNNTYIIDLEADNNNAKIINTLLTSVELASYKSNHKLVIALTIKDGIFQRLIKKNKYIRNPFRKGPLTSIMDFNILIDEMYGNKAFNKSNWNIYPLNYDAI